MINNTINLTKGEAEVLTAIVAFCERYNCWDCYILVTDLPIRSYPVSDLKGIIDKGFINERARGTVVSLTTMGLDFANNEGY
jgi:hypothetical protein